ncbi:MAG: AbrB/MazE/SpoVT family DNA-binding domain-containing protein [Candidatus Njordarchaeia archaeon]
MVKLKIKVGPKGQIIIPKALREAYNIVEGGNVIIEPKDEGILIRKIMSEEELINWLQERKRRLKAKKAKLGELSGVYLEMEFEEE